MLRKTLTILSLIGLLLSVGLWGVTYGNIVYYSAGPLHRIAALERGAFCPRFGMKVTRDEPGGPTDEGGWRVSGFSNLGTAWRPHFKDYGGVPRLRTAAFPFWIPTVAYTLVLCLTRPLYHRRRRKRKKFGLCVKCGYDLRASKERCPECGDEFSS